MLRRLLKLRMFREFVDQPKSQILQIKRPPSGGLYELEVMKIRRNETSIHSAGADIP